MDVSPTPSEMPSASEIEQCASVLRRLKPDQLVHLPDLAAAGEALFRRHIMTRALGSEDAVAAILARQNAKSSNKAQVHSLQGKVQAARADLTKLIDRHAKLSANVMSELATLRALVPSNGSSGGSNDLTTAKTVSSTAVSQVASFLANAKLSAASSTSMPAANKVPDCGVEPSRGAAVPYFSTSASAFSTASTSANYAPNAICDDERFLARPIGRLHTIFVEKNGTPRQGCVCPSSAATLKLNLTKGLNAAHALEGLEAFSHVWIVFVFHLNGNAATKSKVHPPRCDGSKYGLFATRTPHRPNPIGLSLVQLERVCGDTLHLRGIDLVDGTPVLDVKPYVPFADGNGLPDPRVAHWLVERPTQDLSVDFTPAAVAQLEALAPSLRLLANADRAKAAITEILVGDPRSVHWRKQRSDVEYGFSIDCLNVVVSFAVNGVASVTQVQHLDLCDRSTLDGRAGGLPA